MCCAELILVGLLVVAGQGSVAQLFAAVCISFVCFAMQVHLSPYRHPEDNVLKVAVEVQLFLTVTIALVLKCLDGQSSATAELAVAVYDTVLVVSFIICIPVCFVWSICVKRSMMARMREDETLHEDAGSTTESRSTTESALRAIKLLRVGLTSNDDMRLLATYFGGLENLVNKWTHVFISYRVAADRDLARRLYTELSAITLAATGQKLKVYLDQTRLEDGHRWDQGFMEGLSKSWVFVPVISVGSVSPMTAISNADDYCDNVLLGTN